MPIKPENRARYPKNWKSVIRPAILKRANYCCEECGVPDGAIGYRDTDGEFYETPGMQCEVVVLDLGTKVKIIRIVLTIAHVLNPDPADVRDENLRALCQYHHNKLDGPMRAANAARTRRAKKAAGTLALGVE